LDWGVPYIIRKYLERRCLKWARMTHLDTWNTSYGQKKSKESNWQFDFQSLKIRNHPDLLACKYNATYRWKDLDKGYNFASELISIKSPHTKLWTPQSHRNPKFGNLGTPTWESQDKMPFGPVASHRVYYKKEGGDFPQVRAMVSLVNLNLFVARPSIKSVQICTNQLVIWFVQVHVNN
jgi:hypothetical protein